MEKSFDFSIRLIELAKYLRDENKEFPLTERLLICGIGIGVDLRIASGCMGKEKTARMAQAVAYAAECEYLLELMVKTGYLAEQQSRFVLEECAEIIKLLERNGFRPSLNETASKMEH